MLAKLFLMFLSVPLIEIALFITIGKHIGIWMTLLIVVATAILGASLAHQEGLKTWWRIQNKLASGTMPDEELLDALMILVAGAMLLTPGFLTDTFGFLLLLPGTRRIAKRWARRKFSQRMHISYREW